MFRYLKANSWPSRSRQKALKEIYLISLQSIRLQIMDAVQLNRGLADDDASEQNQPSSYDEDENPAFPPESTEIMDEDDPARYNSFVKEREELFQLLGSLAVATVHQQNATPTEQAAEEQDAKFARIKQIVRFSILSLICVWGGGLQVVLIAVDLFVLILHSLKSTRNKPAFLILT